MKYAYSLLRDGVIYQRNRKVLFTVKDLQESETEGEIKSLALFWLKSFNCIIPIHKSGEGKGQRAIAGLKQWFFLVVFVFKKEKEKEGGGEEGEGCLIFVPRLGQNLQTQVLYSPFEVVAGKHSLVFS